MRANYKTFPPELPPLPFGQQAESPNQDTQGQYDQKATNPKDIVGGKKIPLWLLSPIAKAHWALAQFAGMLKYGAWNWRAAGVRYSVYLSAIGRHVDGIMSGEEVDPVDGTDHLGNIMACCAIILDARAAGKLVDDRPPRVDHRRDYEQLEELMAKLRAQYGKCDPRHYTIEDSITDLPAPTIEASVLYGKAPPIWRDSIE